MISKKLVSCAVACGVLAASGLASAASLTANQVLYRGEKLVASGSFAYLEMQTDGNLVMYHRPTSQSIQWKWQTYTVGRGYYAIFQEDGNFVLYDEVGAAIWHSNTVNWGRGGRLEMQNDGNLVMYSLYGSVVWDTHKGIGYNDSRNPLESNFMTVTDQSRIATGGLIGQYTRSKPGCGALCGATASCNAWSFIEYPAPLSLMCKLYSSVASTGPALPGMGRTAYGIRTKGVL